MAMPQNCKQIIARTISLPCPTEGFWKASGKWKKRKKRNSIAANSQAVVLIHILKMIAKPEAINAAPTKFVQNMGAPNHLGTIADTLTGNTK